MTFNTFNATVTTIQRTLPPLDDTGGLEPFEILSPVNPLIAHAHIRCYLCIAVLHNIIADRDPGAYQKVLEAAYEVVQVSRLIRDIELYPIQSSTVLLVSKQYTSSLFLCI